MGFFKSIGNFFKNAGGAVASGLFGLGSSALGASSSNKQIDKQIAAQKEENEKNRAYNLQLAQMQNAWNQEQWERENEYNSPVNQMKRYQEAGLNPDLMYQNGNSGNAMQLSGGMTSGAPSSLVDYSALGQKKTIGDVIKDTLNNEMMRAQIDKVKAETKREGAQTDILRSDAAFRDAWNQGQLDLQKVQINIGNSEIKLNDQEFKKLRYEMFKLDAETKNVVLQYDEIRSRIRDLDASVASRRLHDVLDSKKAEAEIRKLASSAHVDYAVAKRTLTLLSEELLGLQLSNAESGERIANLSFQNDRLQFDLSQDKDYQDVERTSNVITDVCDTLLPIASLIGVAFGGDYHESYHETRVDKDGNVSERYGSRKKGRR